MKRTELKGMMVLGICIMVLVSGVVAINMVSNSMAFKSMTTFGLSEALDRYEELGGAYSKKEDSFHNVSDLQSELDLLVDILYNRMPGEQVSYTYDRLITKVESLNEMILNIDTDTPHYVTQALVAERNILQAISNIISYNEMGVEIPVDDVMALVDDINDYTVANYAKSGEWVIDHFKPYVSHLNRCTY